MGAAIGMKPTAPTLSPIVRHENRLRKSSHALRKYTTIPCRTMQRNGCAAKPRHLVLGHVLGTNENGCRNLLIRQPAIWCGEGDLNPHEIAPASTSS